MKRKSVVIPAHSGREITPPDGTDGENKGVLMNSKWSKGEKALGLWLIAFLIGPGVLYLLDLGDFIVTFMGFWAIVLLMGAFLWAIWPGIRGGGVKSFGLVPAIYIALALFGPKDPFAFLHDVGTAALWIVGAFLLVILWITFKK